MVFHNYFPFVITLANDQLIML